MAMFPIFILGLLAGVVLSAVCFYFIKSVPSNTKFKLQEETIRNTQADLAMLEEENEKLKNQIEKLKEQKTKTTKKKKE